MTENSQEMPTIGAPVPSFDLLDVLIENFPGGISAYDSDLIMRFANQNFFKYLNLDPEEFPVGVPFSKMGLKLAEMGYYGKGDPQEIVAERISSLLNFKPYTGKRYSTTGRSLETRGFSLPNGWIVTMILDVTEADERETELRLSQQQLKETNDRLRAERQKLFDIYNKTPVMLHSIKESGEIIEVSDYWLEKMGYQRHQVIGRSIYDYMDDPDAIRARDGSISNLFADGTAENFENVYTRGDGSKMNVRISAIANPAPDGDGMSTFTVVHDVTEEVQAKRALLEHRDELQVRVNDATQSLKLQAQDLQEALTREKQLNKLQRQFVSMASHEFRTPLAIIDAAIQRLVRRGDGFSPEKIQAQYQKVRDAVKRIERLITSTLMVGKLEHGQIEFCSKDCDIEGLIGSVCADMQGASPSHKIEWMAFDLPAQMKLDDGAIRQVLSNLISNAVRYSAVNSTVAVTAEGRGRNVVLEVKDQGIGIPKEDVPRLFERYYRASNTTGIAGTGIGLNLVKTLVEMHNGSVAVDSELGKGTSVTVRLPIDSAGTTSDHVPLQGEVEPSARSA